MLRIQHDAEVRINLRTIRQLQTDRQRRLKQHDERRCADDMVKIPTRERDMSVIRVVQENV